MELLKVYKFPNILDGGLKKGFFFYTFGFFGTLFMTISFLMILSNALNEQNSIIINIILVKIMKSLSDLSSNDLGTY